jgi:pimeloyl-ACP methyl ester carboxylesterase
VRRGLKAVPGGFSWSSDPRLTLSTPLRYTEEQILAVLRGIQARTLLVLAQPEAPYLPRETMQRRIEQVRDIAVHRIDGSHHLHLENAAPIADLIGDFVSGKA